MQRARAAQVGLLMRSYRESFSREAVGGGLTQEALLERMGSMDSDYAERDSHTTVSRWESGGTRPTTSAAEGIWQSPRPDADRDFRSHCWQAWRPTFERLWVTSPGAMVTGPLAMAQRLT